MRILLMLLVLIASSETHARQINGVELADSQSVKNQTLVLNGAGIRSKYFLDVYVAALYLPQRSSDAEAIIHDDELQSVKLVITSSHITKSRLQDSIEEGVALSAGKQFPKFQPMLAQIWDSITFEVSVGDVFDFTYVPGEGTHFYRNGKQLRLITDFSFKQVLFGIWLGKDPVDASLKEDLLRR